MTPQGIKQSYPPTQQSIHKMNKIKQLYEELLRTYGLQGWWPVKTACQYSESQLVVQGTRTQSMARRNERSQTTTGEQGLKMKTALGKKDYRLQTKQTKTTDEVEETKESKGYHPGKYDYPRTDEERFEICIGAILTQNTAWKNVEKAISNLYEKIGKITPEKILALKQEELAKIIKAAGYYNQKSTYLHHFANYYQRARGTTPTREELLALKGIGKETADSILLYAYQQPTFIIDTYTKRILIKHGYANERSNYDEMQQLFLKQLPKDVNIYQEYHALLVEHAKKHYQKKPYGETDQLLKDHQSND